MIPRKDEQWLLQGVTGAFLGKEFLIVGDELRMGRTEDNDIKIPDPNVSRQQTMILRAAGSWIVRDLGSKNGTFLNGTQIQDSPLEENDIIRIGEAEFRFVREKENVADKIRAQLPKMPRVADSIQGVGSKRLALYGIAALILLTVGLVSLWKRPSQSIADKASPPSPSRKMAHIEASDEEVVSWKSQADVALSRDDFLAAIPLLRKVVAARPTDSGARGALDRAEARLHTMIREYYESGAREFEKLYFDEAITEWQKVLSLSKSFDPEMYKRAQGKIREAEAKLKP